MKLLFETIVLYGDKFTTKSKPVYHGLDAKFNFTEFKAAFRIPTSTTTDKYVARTFEKDNGITLEFGGFESIGERYFNTQSLSAYPDEKEYLFFYSELHINKIYFDKYQFDMSPLSLYESIITGCNIVEKQQLKKEVFIDTQRKLNVYLTNIRKEEEQGSFALQDDPNNGDDKTEGERDGISILKSYREKNLKQNSININPAILKKLSCYIKEKFIKLETGTKNLYHIQIIYYHQVIILIEDIILWKVTREEIDDWKETWGMDQDDDDDDDDEQNGNE